MLATKINQMKELYKFKFKKQINLRERTKSQINQIILGTSNTIYLRGYYDKKIFELDRESLKCDILCQCEHNIVSSEMVGDNLWYAPLGENHIYIMHCGTSKDITKRNIEYCSINLIENIPGGKIMMLDRKTQTVLIADAQGFIQQSYSLSGLKEIIRVRHYYDDCFILCAERDNIVYKIKFGENGKCEIIDTISTCALPLDLIMLDKDILLLQSNISGSTVTKYVEDERTINQYFCDRFYFSGFQQSREQDRELWLLDVANQNIDVFSV